MSVVTEPTTFDVRPGFELRGNGGHDGNKQARAGFRLFFVFVFSSGFRV